MLRAPGLHDPLSLRTRPSFRAVVQSQPPRSPSAVISGIKRTWPLSVVLTLTLGACATAGSEPASTQAAPSRPAASYNLSGYSAAFKEGYSDACASRRNAERINTDADYAMGWNDGQSLCRK